MQSMYEEEEEYLKAKKAKQQQQQQRHQYQARKHCFRSGSRIVRCIIPTMPQGHSHLKLKGYRQMVERYGWESVKKYVDNCMYCCELFKQV